MEKPVLHLDADFDDDAWMWKSKGFYNGALVRFEGKEYSLMIYDKFRVSEDIEEELETSTFFFEKNLIVVPSITRVDIEAALADLATRGGFSSLIPNG